MKGINMINIYYVRVTNLYDVSNIYLFFNKNKYKNNLIEVIDMFVNADIKGYDVGKFKVNNVNDVFTIKIGE